MIIRTLDDAQDRLERLLLLGLEVVEEVALNRWRIDEVGLACGRQIVRLAIGRMIAGCANGSCEL